MSRIIRTGIWTKCFFLIHVFLICGQHTLIVSSDPIVAPPPPPPTNPLVSQSLTQSSPKTGIRQEDGGRQATASLLLSPLLSSSINGNQGKDSVHVKAGSIESPSIISSPRDLKTAAGGKKKKKKKKSSKKKKKKVRSSVTY